jgi:hypothetical protein
MRWLIRLALPLGLAALLAFPAAAGAQTNVKISNLTLLANAPQTGAKATVTNSDLAFWGNRMYSGDYSGFRIFDIANPAAPVLITDFACTARPGTAGQGDISVWQNLVFRSVDTPQTRPDCARTNTAGAGPAQTPGWEGVEIFDVSNPAAPRQVAAVATDCGSHTHTLVPDLGNNRILVYVSSYPAAAVTSQPTQYGNVCERGSVPAGHPFPLTAGAEHDKISIIEVPLNAPQTARVIAEPQYNFAGPGFQGIPGFTGCHDITVHTQLKIAAGACLTEGIIFDISNPAAPTIQQRLVNPAIDTCARSVPNPPVEPLCLWHSSTFTWDGKYMVFGDEDGGGGTPECSTEDPTTDGAFWIHSRANPVNPIAHFKIPRVQFDRPAGDPLADEICTAHIMNFIPINGRYFMPSSWYFGGTSVVDWTNITAPTEFGYFEIDQSTAAGATPYTNTWTSYWYNDFIFTNDINRGVDVLRLNVPWQTQAWNLSRFNPQTQEAIISCTARAHGAMLRATRRGMVHVQVRARGATVLPGQPVVGTRVVLSGAGVNQAKQTNARGEVSFTVRARRSGTLRVNVPTVKNMLGCRTTKRVAAAPRRQPPELTGRPA